MPLKSYPLKSIFALMSQPEPLIYDSPELKEQILRWLSGFRHFAFYDSCAQALALGASNYDWIAAVASDQILEADLDCLPGLKNFRQQNAGFLFGGFCYELKDEIEALNSSNHSHIRFPKLFFFAARHVIFCKDGKVGCHSALPIQDLIERVYEANGMSEKTLTSASVLKADFNKEEYLQTIEKIREHIKLGDIYEMNYCVSFHADNVNPDPLQLYNELRKLSPAPFSALLRWDDKYLVSASPERFMMKKGRRLLSQPIKGTARRSTDIDTDKRNAEELKGSEKERAENVMIVDLVRNDLSRSCEPGTVKVDELFGIYSFPAVHQMISSVSGIMKKDASLYTVIANAFPMGSMTGAPKIMSMKLIERYEQTARGLYSGCVGYITDEDDFDFNVVIRSLLIDRSNKKLAFHVGSAITYDSIAEQEFEECMLKAQALKSVLKVFGIEVQS